MRGTRALWTGVAAVLFVAAGCATSRPVASPPTTSSPASAPRAPTTTSPFAQPAALALAADESSLSHLYAGCGGSCQFETASTTDGSGGTLYAVEVANQNQDGYGRGAVFFFHGDTLLPGTGNLAPQTTVEQGAGLDWVVGPEAAPAVSAPSAGHFAVTYIVSSGPNMCNACDGDAGTDTYTYDWNGSAMTVASGNAPAPPAVIGDGTT
jgi:hypothetical protein